MIKSYCFKRFLFDNGCISEKTFLYNKKYTSNKTIFLLEQYFNKLKSGDLLFFQKQMQDIQQKELELLKKKTKRKKKEVCYVI